MSDSDPSRCDDDGGGSSSLFWESLYRWSAHTITTIYRRCLLPVTSPGRAPLLLSGYAELGRTSLWCSVMMKELRKCCFNGNKNGDYWSVVSLRGNILSFWLDKTRRLITVNNHWLIFVEKIVMTAFYCGETGPRMRFISWSWQEEGIVLIGWG